MGPCRVSTVYHTTTAAAALCQLVGTVLIVLGLRITTDTRVSNIEDENSKPLPVAGIVAEHRWAFRTGVVLRARAPGRRGAAVGLGLVEPSHYLSALRQRELLTAARISWRPLDRDRVCDACLPELRMKLRHTLCVPALGELAGPAAGAGDEPAGFRLRPDHSTRRRSSRPRRCG